MLLLLFTELYGKVFSPSPIPSWKIALSLFFYWVPSSSSHPLLSGGRSTLGPLEMFTHCRHKGSCCPLENLLLLWQSFHFFQQGIFFLIFANTFLFLQEQSRKKKLEHFSSHFYQGWELALLLFRSFCSFCKNKHRRKKFKKFNFSVF